MIIGIDLDNTIINYQSSFERIAKLKKIKINKKFIKKELKQKIERISKNEWTRIQGKIYGEKIHYAKIFENFTNFVKFSIKNKISLVIISHKTKYPILGKKRNLHTLTKKFLETKFKNNYFRINKNLFFETSIQKKIQRIKIKECDFFIDDLEDILSHKEFPKYTEGLLFNSNKSKKFNHFKNWISLIKFFDNKLKEKQALGGKNNNCFTLKNRTIFVKEFNKNFKYELKFHEFLNRKKIKNIPKILSISTKRRVIKYVFYKNLKRKIINKSKIIKIFKFIRKINTLNYKNEKFKYAKDYCNNYSDYQLEIKRRITEHKKNYHYKNNLIYAKIINLIEKKFNELKKINYFKNDFILKKKDLILSPCDFHLENMIFNKKIIFLDFEYSGLDDPAKLFAVFFLQPNHNISKNIFNSSINKILFFKKNILIKERILYLIPIIYLRWSLILMNNFSKKQLLKTSKYLTDRIDYYKSFNLKN